MLNYFVALVSALTQRLDRGDRGATAVEYGLMVALIAAVIIGAVAAIGGALNGLFTAVAGAL
jgi:pilus assembly protein Flp/PilA